MSGNFREIRPSSRANSVTGPRSGRADRSTSRGSMKDHALSAHLWGRGDQEQDDPRAHWAIMAYERGGTSGDIFHVRKWDNDYKYERSTRPLETTSSFGRSEHWKPRRLSLEAQLPTGGPMSGSPLPSWAVVLRPMGDLGSQKKVQESAMKGRWMLGSVTDPNAPQWVN
ncbi:conserved hypothetical protein [Microsporum canis CBS 113480]|uniref:Uncharacterized protein n=1 Tax=Arthroderma otae (strain ATCC MYA-4605 / CBS 113480) TaxID=554155 RepID=C5FJL7_ARTOC|nr:conserved hypothetical protein [Microsporum canis CBS 113480]EEQ30878.1 conserved hypothetical protein [Microsporum canis CBS 113480]